MNKIIDNRKPKIVWSNKYYDNIEIIKNLQTINIKSIDDFKKILSLKKYANKHIAFKTCKKANSFINDYKKLNPCFLDEETFEMSVPFLDVDLAYTKDSISFFKNIYKSLITPIGNNQLYSDMVNFLIGRLIKYQVKTIVFYNFHRLENYSYSDLQSVIQVLNYLNKKVNIRLVFIGKGNYLENIKWENSIINRIIKVQ